MTVDLLVAPRWLVPIEPAGIALTAHALIVDGGRIKDILPLTEAEQKYAPRERLVLDQHAVMPGLVNTHTHAAMSLL
ncbi:MAG: TRZ/ATZ family hydrolase, partial [Pseudomonadota bacterium]|nr:TRZ/ATZ family hydrolase [Pseudomonadota bacterium]